MCHFWHECACARAQKKLTAFRVLSIQFTCFKEFNAYVIDLLCVCTEEEERKKFLLIPLVWFVYLWTGGLFCLSHSNKYAYLVFWVRVLSAFPCALRTRTRSFALNQPNLGVCLYDHMCVCVSVVVLIIAERTHVFFHFYLFSFIHVRIKSLSGTIMFNEVAYDMYLKFFQWINNNNNENRKEKSARRNE